MSTSTTEIVAGINQFFTGSTGVGDVFIWALGGLFGLIILGYVLKFFTNH